MSVEQNKIDAIMSLEAQGILESNESRRCIDVLIEESKLNNESCEIEEEIFFAD